MTQSVKHPTSAQVMILQSMSSSPALGSVLTTRSLELALDSVPPSLSLPQPTRILSLSLSKINIKKVNTLIFTAFVLSTFLFS